MKIVNNNKIKNFEYANFHKLSYFQFLVCGNDTNKLRKMNNRKILMLVLASLFILLSVQSVLAIGITPGRTTMNFEPGLHKQVSFSILNSENKDMSVVFYAQGDLKDYITLDQEHAIFSSEEESKSFTYTVSLPQKFEKPGLYKGEIVALEMPKEGIAVIGDQEKKTIIGTAIAVVIQLHVYVPYPNKYLEAEVNVIESDKGELVFLIPVINRGKLDIVDAKAIIDIYSGDGEKIETIESDSEFLTSLERKELVVNWRADVNPGRYKAIITVRYDNEITTILKEFNVGEMFLQILEINIKDFELGGIAKFDTLIENKWSSDLRDVYLNIIVYNHEGEIMADFKSPTYDIDQLSKIEMVAYWDTAGVKKGTYDGKIFLRYGEKSTEKDIQMKITDYDIEVIGITGHVTVKKKGAFSLTNILIILVVFLILVNIIWFVVIKRIMKKKKT